MIQIRLAGSADIPALIQIGRLMHEETRYQAYLYDEEKVTKCLQAYTSDTSGKYGMLMAMNGEEILGFLFAIVEEYWFCEGRVATNIGWYVAPRARGSSAATKLIMGYRRWAKNRGANELNLAISSAHHIERTDKMLRRMGFANVGGNYSLSLK